ncbi:hypothetical protein BGZ73_006002 [Actinomortierella ambigua]|nr:hypothetical protein BGZ73_006002 [Actinomortierella ambigua]
MKRFRSSNGPKFSNSFTKAPATQQCQKCLQYGHYTYECKGDRVYSARPTRTQQLHKPVRRIQVEVPEEFLSKSGLAAKILKEKEEERQRKKEEKDKKQKKKKRRRRQVRKSAKPHITFRVVSLIFVQISFEIESLFAVVFAIYVVSLSLSFLFAIT